MERELHSERIAIERKVFFFDLKENNRGRFLKITEDVSGRRDTIIIPATGLTDFVSALEAAIEAENELPEMESHPPEEGGDGEFDI